MDAVVFCTTLGFDMKIKAIFLPHENGNDITAHCLDFDVVTMGSDFKHAKKMLEEAVVLTLKWDKESNLNPNRRIAQGEDFEEFDRLLKSKSKKPPCALLMEIEINE